MVVKCAGRSIEINDNERQECEIWTRVMGYYRPVKEFNIGKKQEARERVYYTEQETTHLIEGGTE